jgi:hypothetical protein
MKPSTLVLLLAAGLGAAYFIMRSKSAKAAKQAAAVPPPPVSGTFTFLPPSPLRPAAPGMVWTQTGANNWVEMPKNMG